MAIYKVIKRTGSIVTFDNKKITNAIQKALAASWQWEDISIPTLTQTVIEEIEKQYTNSIPHVETIQDIVEQVLIKADLYQAAKAYILYREKRNEARKDKNVMIEVKNSMEEYLEQNDRRVNANANSGYSLGGLILNTAGKVTANYWLSHIYPHEVGNAHRNADIHIHDLDMFTGYCAGWSLRQLLEEGFNGVSNRVESTPPKNLQSAVNQMINFLWTLQNEWAGAQAFSSFDTYLAPFVHKYKNELVHDLEDAHVSFTDEQAKAEYIAKKTYEYVLQQMQNFIFWLNVPSRWGTQTPFTNITLDRTCPLDLKEKALFLGWLENGAYIKKFGELETEMWLINKALIEVYTHGDAKGRVFTFPIPTYNITEDFPWEDSTIDLLFEMTAKYGIPYFQNFVWSQFKYETTPEWKKVKVRNPDAYTPGAVRSMCCRLQLDLTQLTKRGNGLFGSAEMTGSIGVVTLNIARMWYLHKGNKEEFFAQVSALMHIAKTSLELKRKVLEKWLDAWLYPYTKRYLASFRNHFSTIGLNGVNEAIRNFTDDKEDITTERWKKFATELLEYMRIILKTYQEETGNLYNLEATPAEGTTYRFAKEDKKQHPDMIQAWTQEAPYYTNSTQMPVGQTDDVFEALEYQNDLQCKYTWWTVLHLYMGERISNAQACKALVKKVIGNYQLPYITITPTFSICPKHGYIVGEHDFCPKCDQEIWYTWQKFDITTRKIYTEYADKITELEQATI